MSFSEQNQPNARTAESVTRLAGQKLDSLLILTRFISSALISLDSIHTRFMDPACCSTCQASRAEACFILDSWTVCTDQPRLDSYSIHGSCLLLCLTGKQGVVVYPLFGKVNLSFVCKLVMMFIIDIIFVFLVANFF